ncbi:MAG: beta-propeller domain-containing protein, partial [Clostridia bacterium]|nr:beta-propeller domain-containing protein [Clostridia bacterium]
VECSVIDNLTTEDYRKFYYGSINENVITMAVCFDISDRSSPVETWRTYQDGSYISSRLIGEQLVIMSTYGVDITDDEAAVVESCVPMYGTDMDSYKRVPCDCICVMEEIYDTRYLVASTLDIKDVNTLKTQAVLGAGEDVYCTTETLYAVSTRYESASDMAEVFSYSTEAKTYIYKFDIRGGDINYLGNGVVKGSTLNQFSMDEHNGYLRIATTMGNWGDSLENQVYVLDSSLQVVGEITGIAKGETIKSVRFTGDTGYVVTFEQTDPLFVIDLSNPASPVIRGELKIPGFSAYLHPVGDGLLLGVGADGDENGQNGGIKVSLFDVSDPQNPVECDKITVSAPQGENRYTYLQSEAYYTHKAMCWDAENAIMYVPYAEMIDIYTTTGYEGVHYGNILAVKVDVVNKKLSDDGSCKVLTSDTESYGSFVRATYIDNVVFGYVQDVNTFYSFNKATQEYLNKIKLG